VKRAVLLALALSATAGRPAIGSAPVAEPAWTWTATTVSPVRLTDGELTDREAELQAACGMSEGGLRLVAKRLVARKIRDLPYLDIDGLTFAERAAGEPHVWPRAFIVSGRALDHATTIQRLAAWRQSFHDLGERRCGVATGYAPDGTEVVAAIALDAAADLAPLPVRTRVGLWLTVSASLLVPATGAEVIVMGPSGEPHAVPSSFAGGRVEARFTPDRAGPFTVQVVADVATGPRPVLEAALFADVEPPTSTPNLAAPGEEAGVSARTEAEALASMVGAMRAYERLPPLARDARLDAIALAHARRMKEANTIGHDVGDGDPALRLQNAGLSAREAGENVAHAQSVALAHRALYASPSHRANLVRAAFDKMGVAVVDDRDGSMWVAEVFARGLR
jgi:uncharacterized protein YkwD